MSDDEVKAVTLEEAIDIALGGHDEDEPLWGDMAFDDVAMHIGIPEERPDDAAGADVAPHGEGDGCDDLLTPEEMLEAFGHGFAAGVPLPAEPPD
eukprot:9471534-Pyramimonas_sp.AAC.1